MVERLIVAGVLIVFGIVAWVVFNRLSVQRIAKESQRDPLLMPLQSGVPAVVYFTTPMCEPCRTLQKPALLRLQDELGSGVQVLQIDATEQPDAADRWGVFSAPTTFILDKSLTPRQVNRGVATAETLKRQLQAIAS